MRGFWLALVAVGFVAGCSDVTVPLGWRRQPAVVSPYVLHNLTGRSLLELPQQVVAGRPTLIAVNTLGLGSCVRRGDTTVEVSGLTVRIRPYDLVPREPAGCSQTYSVLRREVTVIFASAGTARIIVGGHGMDGVTYYAYDATLTVQPPGTAAPGAPQPRSRQVACREPSPILPRRSRQDHRPLAWLQAAPVRTGRSRALSQ